MKRTLYPLLLVAVLGTAGCQTAQNQPAYPQPATTPFDSEPMARAAYLEGYRDGYRAVTVGNATTTDILTGPHRTAREMGWRAGSAEARRAASTGAGAR